MLESVVRLISLFIFIFSFQSFSADLPKSFDFIYAHKKIAKFDIEMLKKLDAKAMAKELTNLGQEAVDEWNELYSDMEINCFSFESDEDLLACEQLDSFSQDIMSEIQELEGTVTNGDAVENLLSDFADIHEVLVDEYGSAELGESDQFREPTVVNTRAYSDELVKSEDPFRVLHAGLTILDRHSSFNKGHTSINKPTISKNTQDALCAIEQVQTLGLGNEVETALIISLKDWLTDETLPSSVRIQVYCTLLNYYQTHGLEDQMDFIFINMPDGNLPC